MHQLKTATRGKKLVIKGKNKEAAVVRPCTVMYA